MKEVFYDFYPLDICGLHRELPIIPLSDNLAIASFNMIGDVLLVEACAWVLAERVFPYQPDTLVAIEAKGFDLVYQIARLLKMERYVPIRKGPKVYMENPLIAEETSITTTGTQRFVLDRRQAALLEGKRVAFVDDVISTGGSERAACRLIEQAGGVLVCEAFVLREGIWVEDRPDFIYLGKLPLLEPAPSGGWKPKM